MSTYVRSVPRNFFCYWSGSELSALNLATVETFLFHHPDDHLIIYTSINKEGLSRPWSTGEQGVDLNCGLTLDNLSRYPRVRVQHLDLEKEFGVPRGLSAVYLADITRVLILQRDGGVWIDLDIIFLRTIPNFLFEFEGEVVAASYRNTIAVGIVFAKQQSKFLSQMKVSLYEKLESGRFEGYQTFGPDLWKEHFLNFPKLQQNILFFEPRLFYPFMHNEIPSFFSSTDLTKIDDAIGVHWYNGSNVSREFIKKYSLTSLSLEKIPQCTARHALERGGVGLSDGNFCSSKGRGGS